MRRRDTTNDTAAATAAASPRRPRLHARSHGRVLKQQACGGRALSCRALRGGEGGEGGGEGGAAGGVAFFYSVTRELLASGDWDATSVSPPE